MYSPKEFQQELNDCAQRIDQLRAFGVPGQLRGEDLLTALRTTLLAVRKLESLQTQLIDRCETTRAAKKLGAATSDIVSHTIGMSKKEANGIVLRAVDRAQYPRLETAYAEGKLGDRAMRLTMRALKWLKKDLPAEIYPEAERKAVKLGTELVDGYLARALEELVSSYPQSLPRLQRERQEVEQQRGIFFSAVTGGWSLSGLLPEVEGNIVRRALGVGARKERARRLNHKLPPLPEPARVADALVDLCRRHLPADDGEDRSAGGARAIVSGQGVAGELHKQDRDKEGNGREDNGKEKKGKVDSSAEAGSKKKSADTKRSRKEKAQTKRSQMEKAETKRSRMKKVERERSRKEPKNDDGGNATGLHHGAHSAPTTENVDSTHSATAASNGPGTKEVSQGAQTLFAGSGIMPISRVDGSMELGREARLASAEQRAALLRRDGGCIVPKCDALPETCEVHHVKRWGLGGATNLSNLVLLCPHHHWMADHPQAGLVILMGRTPTDPARGRFETLDQLARAKGIAPAYEDTLLPPPEDPATTRSATPLTKRRAARGASDGQNEDAKPP